MNISALVSILSSLAADPFIAEAPLYIGLPESIDADLLYQEGFLEFSQLEGGMRAPLGAGVEFNGERIDPHNREALSVVFSEVHFANVPGGTRIRAKNDSQGQEVWSYPEGTRVAHKISIKTRPEKLFELRMIQKRADGTWAFGTYIPRISETTGAPLKLSLIQTSERQPYFEATNQIGEKNVSISLTRIRSTTCQRCHAATSPSSHQYPTLAETGPCGFVPANRENVLKWSDGFAQKHGAVPFE